MTLIQHEITASTEIVNAEPEKLERTPMGTHIAETALKLNRFMSNIAEHVQSTDQAMTAFDDLVAAKLTLLRQQRAELATAWGNTHAAIKQLRGIGTTIQECEQMIRENSQQHQDIVARIAQLQQELYEANLRQGGIEYTKDQNNKFIQHAITDNAVTDEERNAAMMLAGAEGSAVMEVDELPRTVPEIYEELRTKDSERKALEEKARKLPLEHAELCEEYSRVETITGHNLQELIVRKAAISADTIPTRLVTSSEDMAMTMMGDISTLGGEEV